MEALLQRISAKKSELDQYKNIPQPLIKNLYEWTKIKATYNSNAIEGNTLTEGETALIVEKNITVPGKTINEHLEAINYARAIDFIKQLSSEKKRSELTVDDLLAIHKIILSKIDDAHAGIFRNVAVRILGSNVPRPNYLKVQELMSALIDWINKATDHPAQIAADAHLKLVFIHPFVDGNGRTARLLLNLILLQAGYPLTIIENKDRPAYINGIEAALMYDKKDVYYTVIFEAIERSLDAYLAAIKESKL